MALENSTILRSHEFPTIWCTGCGHGIITQAIIRAVDSLGVDKNDVYAVSGIGCSARTPAYMDFNSMQTTHGRALAFATGIKMLKPDKLVLLTLGDGDCTAIGGNHFIHACRRNIDMTVIIMNNWIYGMTGGQVSPCTPHNAMSTTTPFGNIDEPFDVCKLALAAGATFVARTTAYHVGQMTNFIKKGLEHKGMSVIEILEPCPTNYGGRNGYGVIGEMYDYLSKNVIAYEKAKDMTPEEIGNRHVVGIFPAQEREEYTEKFLRMRENIVVERKQKSLEVVKKDDAQKKIKRYEFLLSGLGGQGLLTSGMLLSESLIRQGMNAIHTQSYGVESRGGSSRSEVVVSDFDINYTEVMDTDFTLTMSQDAFDKFAADTKKGGICLIDSTMVKSCPIEDVKSYEYPITEYAINLGEIRAANTVALGIIAGLVDFVSRDSLLESILGRLPAKVHDINRTAFLHGYEQGKIMRQEQK